MYVCVVRMWYVCTCACVLTGFTLKAWLELDKVN